MSAAFARSPSRLAAARQRAEDAKAALATGAVVLFSATGLAVAATHPGHHKTASVQQQSEQDDTAASGSLSGGTLAPATSAPTASTSQS